MNIDWTKPLELMDGTPVVLAKHGREYGDCTNPDGDGDYWIIKEGDAEDAINAGCYHFDGTGLGVGKMAIRNRAAPTEQPKTLRDEFAMAALQGMVTGPQQPWKPEIVAGEAYALADAMMAERERGQ